MKLFTGIIIGIFLIFGAPSYSQNEALLIFENLVNREWKAEGKWADGKAFNQHTIFSFALDSTLVIAETKGFVDQAPNKFGNRNFGIRRFNKKTNEIEFAEYDVFGGLTKGTVEADGKNILYKYEYGGMHLTDMWTYISDSCYDFRIGVLNEGKWEQEFLSGQFFSKEAGVCYKTLEALKRRLVGHWSSRAWDGKLEEYWTTDYAGNLVQDAVYSEGDEILFESSNKIEIIKNDLILTSVIKNSNPKVFKMTSSKNGIIVFENSEYAYPNTVTYTLLKNKYNREIKGNEDGESKHYLFEFEKIESKN